MGHRFPTIRPLFPLFATSGLLLVTSQWLFDPFGLRMAPCVNSSKKLCVRTKIRNLEVPRVIFKVLVPPFAPICPQLPPAVNTKSGNSAKLRAKVAQLSQPFHPYLHWSRPVMFSMQTYGITTSMFCPLCTVLVHTINAYHVFRHDEGETQRAWKPSKGYHGNASTSFKQKESETEGVITRGLLN
jgi:hypothetical protein